MSRFYGLDTFQPGDAVQIAGAAALADFSQIWKFHHPLQSVQLPFAGRPAKVANSSMYHGADILYELEGVPDVWHQQLLSSPRQP